MPETKQVRAVAAKVAQQLGKTPWYEHREEVLPTVYAQLGLGPYRKRCTASQKKRKRAPECCVCLTATELVILAPCGHRCICAACNGSVQRCPLCRSPIESVVRTVY